MVDRRTFIKASAAAVAAGGALLEHAGEASNLGAPAEVGPGPGRLGVEVPNGKKLEFRRVGGVKVFHLIAAPLKHELIPGVEVECWGYNGSTPGPLIEVVEGDRVRIYVSNALPAPTSVHWHGVMVPNGMDGVRGLTQAPIRPGQTHKYEFVFKHPGTYMYHPHYDDMTQSALGMMGMIVVHPKEPRGPRADRDFALMLSTWFVEPGARRPNPLKMSDFNVLTFNSKAYPGTAPWVVQRGQRVRVRFGNLSAMDHHAIHFHGVRLKVVATDGGPIPEAGQWPETSVLVPTGSTRDVEFIPELSGDWPVHCHMTHHAMNQMGHAESLIGADTDRIQSVMAEAGERLMVMGSVGMGEHGRHLQHMKHPENSAPMLGAEGPFGFIDMGGMFTLLKVRDRLENLEDPGWYKHPEGTLSATASEEELAKDGVVPPAGEE
ncbi:MAG: copper oxidase [Myxococcota bacterium]